MREFRVWVTYVVENISKKVAGHRTARNQQQWGAANIRNFISYPNYEVMNHILLKIVIHYN